MSFWTRRKAIDTITAGHADSHQLKKTLSWPHLVALGVGAIVGTGIYTLTGVGAGLAGPGVILSFLIAGAVCACAALCYAELSTMIPASGEFTYATQAIRKTDGGATVPENLNALADSTDMVEALDRLQAMAPAVESVSLVVAWLLSAVAPIPLVLLARTYASVYVIPSESMAPALAKNDVLLVDKARARRACALRFCARSSLPPAVARARILSM